MGSADDGKRPARDVVLVLLPRRGPTQHNKGFIHFSRGFIDIPRNLCVL